MYIQLKELPEVSVRQRRKLTMKNILCHLKYFYILLLWLPGYSVAANKILQESSNNCDIVGVDYRDHPEMTRAEKLAQMEHAFYASLHEFEDCIASSSASSESTSSSAGDGGQSMMSEALQGPESELVKEQPSPSNNTDNLMDAETGPASSANNGRVPDDIPLVENDDVLAAQIRLAAEAETDPETRGKLWNEYRNYKGMTVEQ
jgi:phosphatidate phosphatase PAH1